MKSHGDDLEGATSTASEVTLPNCVPADGSKLRWGTRKKKKGKKEKILYIFGYF